MEKAWGSLIAQNRGLCQTLSKEPTLRIYSKF